MIFDVYTATAAQLDRMSVAHVGVLVGQLPEYVLEHFVTIPLYSATAAGELRRRADLEA